MDAATIPLSPEDRAILDLESPHIAGHTCKVIVLAGERPGIDELREAIFARFEAAPELSRRLDGPADTPVWREDPDLDPALVWRIHHALADGTTAIRLARAVLFDAGPSPFDARIGTRRNVEFARLPLGPLHDGAKRLAGATVNDAVLACVAGGQRHWIEEHHGRLKDVRVKVPVSLHQQGDSVGNRDSYFALCLPVSEADSVERLRRIHSESVERKEKHDAAEIGGRHALRIAALSYAGDLYLGLCADPDVVHDLGDLALAIEAESQSFL